MRALLPALLLAAPVLAQPFGPSGSAFRVNTTTAGSQYDCAAAVDPLFGSFVVTWVGPDGDGNGVFGRRFDHSGAPLDGSDFRINANSTGDQIRTRAAAADLTRFVVVWERDASGGGMDVFAQRYDSTGEAGGVFQVSTTTPAYLPAVAADSALNFITVWASGGLILGQRVSSAGVPLGGEFQVSQGTFLNNSFPRVARATTGPFVVVYNKGFELYARRYSAAGAPLAPEFQVNEQTGGSTGHPNVAMTPSGFVVTWQHLVSGDANVKARLFDSAGAPVTGEFRVNAITTGYQWFADAGMDANGNFVVVWQDQAGHDGSQDGVFARRYDASGSPLGGEFRVNSATTGLQRKPAIAMQPNGDFVVSWTDYGSTSGDVVIQRFCHALAGDANASGTIDVSDVFYLINFLFAGGPAPVCPVPMI
jgi:hypothetical protein